MNNRNEQETSLYRKQYTTDEPLLKKYNLVIEQLDYKFIGTCTSGKELEKIIHVLESGQEGSYPDLIRYARKRLADVDPKNKCLRESVKIINKSELTKDYKANLVSDMKEYLSNINTDNQELSSLNKMSIKTNEPPVRETQAAQSIQKNKQENRIKSTDYVGWDKFDVDTKLLEMDLEEERMKKENEKQTQLKKKLNEININKEINSNAELSKNARDFCNAGKECLAEKDYENAMYYFNNSISVKPTSEAYSYRGLAFAKSGKYSSAMADLTRILQIDTNNTTALYGKAIALKGLEQYKEALKCTERLIIIDPNSESYQKLASELQLFLDKNKSNNRRSVRLKIK